MGDGDGAPVIRLLAVAAGVAVAALAMLLAAGIALAIPAPAWLRGLLVAGAVALVAVPIAREVLPLISEFFGSLVRPKYGPMRDALSTKRTALRHEKYERLRDQYLDYASGNFWRAATVLGADLMSDGTAANSLPVSVRGKRNRALWGALWLYVQTATPTAEEPGDVDDEPWHGDEGPPDLCRIVAATIERFVFPGIDVAELADELSDMSTEALLRRRAQRAYGRAGVSLDEVMRDLERVRAEELAWEKEYEAEQAQRRKQERAVETIGMDDHERYWQQGIHADGVGPSGATYWNTYWCPCGATTTVTGRWLSPEETVPEDTIWYPERPER
jgi:hypothetical protein